MSNQASLEDISNSDKESKEEKENDEPSKKRVGEVIELVKGKKPSEVLEEKKEGAVPYLVVDTMTNGSMKYTTETDLPKAEKKDTVMIMDGSKSGRSYYGNSGVVGSTMAVIRPKGVNPYYLNQFLTENFNRLNSATRGSAVPHTDKDLLRGLEIIDYPLSEQRRIASVLYNVDQAIQKTEEIIKQTQRVKKGLMQDLFTEGYFEHEETEELFFGKIPEDWKFVSLDECAEVTKLAGFEYTKQFEEDDEGEIYALTAVSLKGNKLNIDGDTKKINREKAEELDRSKLRKGDVAFTYIGNYIGECAYIPESEKYHLGPNVAKISPGENLSGKFLHKSLQTSLLNKQIQARISSTGQPALSMTKIRQLKVPIPKEKEQKKIVEILEHLVEEIEKHKQEKEQLQRLKKGLMQDLLTGEVRTSESVEVLDEVMEVES